MAELSDEQLLYWIWLSNATVNAPVIANTLLKFFSGPKGVYEADEDALEQVDCSLRGRMALLADKDLDRAQSILDYCREHGVGIVTLDDFFYPERLKSIYNRPILMYYLGNFIDFDASPCVAVVGTRKASDYGTRCAKRISYDLASAGAVTVSGLATGVDSCAHKASLYCNEFTVAVLGCGIDVVYPKENAELYAQVARNGLILTEYPPSTPPLKKNFPLRNRILSGLSCACAVIEASQRSGALYTAEYALRQKRPLFSVPGSVFFEGCRGRNALLALGAKPLLSAEPILALLGDSFPDRIRYRPGEDPPKPTKKKEPKKKKLFSAKKEMDASAAAIPPLFEAPKEKPRPSEESEERPPRPDITCLNETQLKLYVKLSSRPLSPDELVDEDTPVKVVLKTLTALELKGFVKKHPGGRFSVTDEE